ncbi:MAG: PD40 domain-containing protein [Candidatus Yanofskybacteria bacterium]|nr:PD40 domain-containing protein [Candidatus Yanofskybacteria bacterium]
MKNFIKVFLVILLLFAGFIGYQYIKFHTLPAGTNVCIEKPQTSGCDVNKINTLGWEDSPFVSGDGQKFYFMYNSWQLFPVFIGGQVYHPGIVRPGHNTNMQNPAGEKSSQYVAEKKSDGTWTTPVRLFEGCCAMTHDGKTFYYQIEIISGNNDIVSITQKSDGTWGEPVNFGPAISSDLVEDNPHISFAMTLSRLG